MTSWADEFLHKIRSLKQSEVKSEKATESTTESRSRGQQEEIPSGAAVKELIPRNPDYLLTYRPTISRDGLAFVKLGKVLFEQGETVQSSELNSTNRLKAGWSNDIIKIARPWFAAMFDDR